MTRIIAGCPWGRCHVTALQVNLNIITLGSPGRFPLCSKLYSCMEREGGWSKLPDTQEHHIVQRPRQGSNLEVIGKLLGTTAEENVTKC